MDAVSIILIILAIVIILCFLFDFKLPRREKKEPSIVTIADALRNKEIRDKFAKNIATKNKKKTWKQRMQAMLKKIEDSLPKNPPQQDFSLDNMNFNNANNEEFSQLDDIPDIPDVPMQKPLPLEEQETVIDSNKNVTNIDFVPSIQQQSIEYKKESTHSDDSVVEIDEIEDLSASSVRQSQSWQPDNKMYTSSINNNSNNFDNYSSQIIDREFILPKIQASYMQIPAAVKQGEKDIVIPFRLQNLDIMAVNLLSIRLRFEDMQNQVHGEYTVMTATGGAELLPPNTEKEMILHVYIPADAPLGNMTITPILLISWNDNIPQEIALIGNKPYIWLVQENEYLFKIDTMHSGTEVAGVPFWVKIIAYENGSINTAYSGLKTINFSLSETSNTTVKLPSKLDIFFDSGIAVTNTCFCFYNAIEKYTLQVFDSHENGPRGILENIKLLPGELGSFRLELQSPQKNNTVLEGKNELIVIDLYDNVKLDYHGDVVLGTTDGKIRGIPQVGNIISGANFKDGIADLTSLGIKINLPNLSASGQVVKVFAKADGKIGYSNEVTIIPSSFMPPSATQALIQKLWGCRKKKIWISSKDEDMTKDLQEKFQADYDVTVQLLEANYLESFVSNPPNVLFLDATDPDTQGYDILREICRTPNMECLYILFIGPATETERKIAEVVHTGSAYVTKPISIPTLRAMVAEYLENISVQQGNMPTRGVRLQGSEGNVYQIISKVGEGGMGFIYEAKRLKDQKKVIIKYLPPRDFQILKSVVRFIQEAYTVLSFHNQNLVTGYDMVMDKHRCFYVMEFINGKTIEELIRVEKKIEPLRALRIILQVAGALASLEEEHNLVHRDIKPSNILVTQHGLVKLVDFGIAKVSNHHLTTVGIILGTPYYLSPEQILGKDVTIQSDIYSLGATFYHMVTGEHPFQGTDVYNIIHQRLNNDPKDPRLYTPALPKMIAELILRMMDRNPKKRFDHCSSLIVEIESILQFLS